MNSHAWPERVKTNLFSQSHDLESLEVGQVASSVLLFLLLSIASLSPFGVDAGLLPSLSHSSSSGTSGAFFEAERCEGDMGERDGLAWDDLLFISGRAINQDLYF